MNKKLLPTTNENEQIGVLKSYSILDSQLESKFDRLTKLASLACNVPFSLISLLDDNRKWYKSRFNLDPSLTPGELAFCQYTLIKSDFFEVEDALNDERFVNNLRVTQDPKIRFYAGIPLIDPKGYTLGTLCVIDIQPNKLTQNQIQILQLLAEEV